MRNKLYGGPEYRAWGNMLQRCMNPNATYYEHYGGRRIRVAREWTGKYGFKSFYAHVGPRPSAAHSLDRIDNNGHYVPGNVRWATRKEQAANRRPRRTKIQIVRSKQCKTKTAKTPSLSLLKERDNEGVRSLEYTYIVNANTYGVSG